MDMVATQIRQFSTSCVDEARTIMTREWSNHAIDPQDGNIDMKLRLRRISGDTSLSFLSYGAGIRVRPIQRDDVVLMQMPIQGSATASFPDGDVSLHQMACAAIDVRALQQATYSAEFAMLVLRVRRQRLEQKAHALLGHRPRGVLRFLPGTPPGGLPRQGWRPLAAMLAALDADPADMPRAILAPLEDAVLSGLLLSQPNSYSAELSRPAASVAPRHVVRAEEFVREHLHLSLTTEMIAAHVEVSVRALFDGFKTFRGVSPAGYVREAKLRHAREDLAVNGESVAAVAARYGFGQTSNFAVRYRQRYGELPAATRRFGSRSA